MKDLDEILTLAQFPEAAEVELTRLFRQIEADPDTAALLQDTEDRYFAGEDTQAARETLAERLACHLYTVDLLLPVACAPRLREIYREKGYTEEMFLGVLSDLRCKLIECQQVFGMVGTFVFPWFFRFFDCTRFALGRLQYEPVACPFSYGEQIREGDPVLKCHIPSSGTLSPQSVDDSLAQARAFFGDSYRGIVCHSWMLYPPHRALFSEGSNLMRFYDRFEIVSEESCEIPTDAWRVFHVIEKDLSKLPRETSLQRNLFQYLSEGKKMGIGWGVLR